MDFIIKKGYGANWQAVCTFLLIALCCQFANSEIRLIDGLYFNVDPSFKHASLCKRPDNKPYEIENLVIPDSVEYNTVKDPVTVINDAFVDNKHIKTFVCPNTDLYILFGSFSGSTLENIVFPEETVWIGADAFWGCEELDTIVFNSKSTYIEYCFWGTNFEKIIFKGDATLSSLAISGSGMSSTLPNSECSFNDTPYRQIDIDWGDGEIFITRDAFNGLKTERLVFSGNVRVVAPNYGRGHGLYEIKSIEFEAFRPIAHEPDVALEPYTFIDAYDLEKVVCHDPEPWSATTFVFSDRNPADNITLYVPRASLDKYRNHEAWGKFGTILAIEDSASDAGVDPAEYPVEYYDLSGVRVTNPTRGPTVIRRQGAAVTKIRM